MNKEFIPYEPSFDLKELGFNEECLAFYNSTFQTPNELLYPQYGGEVGNWNVENHLISAPLYQQAFRWFREKYDSSYWVQKDWEEGNFLGYEGTIEYPDGFQYCGTFNTYEEAELACLKKLIEIIKNK